MLDSKDSFFLNDGDNIQALRLLKMYVAMVWITEWPYQAQAQGHKGM